MTPKERAAMQQALEALEELHYSSGTVVAARMYESATAALREALAGVNMSPTEQTEQKPVAEVVLRSHKVGFGRTEERKDIVFLTDVDVGAKLYAAPVPITTPNICGEVCERAKLCYGCGKNLDEANAEHERKYGELAGTHNWTPPNYTDEQWQKLDQEYQDHVAEQAEQGVTNDTYCS